MSRSWLYDDNKPFLHLEELETIEFLKKQADQGYFEKLVREYLLDNPHTAVVVAKPEYGLNAKREEQLNRKLQAF